MQQLSEHGQQPEVMVVACSDSRVDPAIVLQASPGDLFTVRNVANIVPAYQPDSASHGTSAALEYGVRYLQVKHLIIWGHSQCGGVQAFKHGADANRDDFISHWLGNLSVDDQSLTVDQCSQQLLHCSYQNCLSFPWIAERVEQQLLVIHRWFFDIARGEVSAFDVDAEKFSPLL